MPMVIKKVEQICKVLKKLSVIPVEEITDLEAIECGYKKNNIPPAEGWQPMTYLCGADKHFWIRGSFRTPAAEEGTRYLLDVRSDVKKGWDATNPQGLLYLNGKMVQGLDINHTEAFLEPDQEYQMYIYYYIGELVRPFLLSTQLVKLDVETEGLYYDLEVPREALDYLNENTAEYRDTLSALEQELNLLDLRSPYSP